MHGYVRATKDINILICEEVLTNARRIIASIGCDPEAGVFKFDPGTDRETRLFRVPRAEGSMLTTLGLILVTPNLTSVWNDREVVRAYDTGIKVVSKAAPIALKEIADRHQDLADIESLRNISDEGEA